MAEYLFKKKGGGLWYYRRRFPSEVVAKTGKHYFMKSLQTTVKREASSLSRRVSVEFDMICQAAAVSCEAVQLQAEQTQSQERDLSLKQAEAIIERVPGLLRLAATRVVEAQLENPRDWRRLVSGWQAIYRAATDGHGPASDLYSPIEAQAILNGLELAVEGKEIPVEQDRLMPLPADLVPRPRGSSESWAVLCQRALKAYGEKVGGSRHKLAASRLLQVSVKDTTEHHVLEGLKEWCDTRLKEVQPRTVKGQLDAMTSALRCVMPKLPSLFLKELKGVMQPRATDRESMPVQAIRAAILTLQSRACSHKTRNSYNGGASQFDAIAVETLAVLGLRPRELVQAKPSSLVEKTDVKGRVGIYFRVKLGKNKAAERDIPLCDGKFEAVDLSRLRDMLNWQELNPRKPHSAVSSLSTRFREATKEYSPYQMRHSWKDLAVDAGVDFEIRERILGHRVRGVAAVYGSGVPLEQGLAAIKAVRDAIWMTKKQIA